MPDNAQFAPVAQRFDRLVGNVCRVIQGKNDVVQQAVICLLSEGHLLLEDVPGTGKTMLARALANSLSMTWNRIQFTPDLLPTDITGVSVFNQAKAEFTFRPGPVFANIIIGDEINRASPKTQSALLEVMEERTVTTDSATYSVPTPFMVVATQNPIDMAGTYQLPEAQLDRFLMKVSMGYPAPEHEIQVLRTQKNGPTVTSLGPVMAADDVKALIEAIKGVEVSEAIERYIVELVTFTRTMPELRLGVSPRGGLSLLRAARTTAACAARSYVLPEDVKAMATSVLSHRIILNPEAELQGRTAAQVIAKALQAVPVPRTVNA